MRLLVLGATGGIGKYLLEYATARGHEVTALARSPQKIALKSEKLRAIPGDLLNEDQLAQVMPGHDAVLSAFGPSTLRSVTTRREFGKVLAAATEPAE
jgi:putative NADH-flavin reductase